MTTRPHKHDHPHSDPEQEDGLRRAQKLAMFLEAHFGDPELHWPDETKITEGTDEEEPTFWIRVDDHEASIELVSLVSNMLRS